MPTFGLPPVSTLAARPCAAAGAWAKANVGKVASGAAARARVRWRRLIVMGLNLGTGSGRQ